MTLTSVEIAERVEAGAVHALTTFEIAGKPKEHVEKTLTEYVERLDSAEKFLVQSVMQEEAIELEDSDGIFSAFAEVNIVLPDLESLTHVAINMMPASIEVLAPDSFSMSARDLQNWYNDLLSHLHTLAQGMQEQNQKNRFLHNRLNGLLSNTIVVLLTIGAKDIPDLMKLTGVDEDYMTRFLAKLEEEEVVEKEGEKWILRSSKK